MDVVSDVLRMAGVRGLLGARTEAGGRWAVAGGASSSAGLHAVTAGEAWLTRAGRPPLRLRTGDVVLFASGTRYVLGNASGTPPTACDPGSLTRARRTGAPMRLGTGVPDTTIVSVAFACDPGAWTRLPFTPPELLHVPSGGGNGNRDTSRDGNGGTGDAYGDRSNSGTIGNGGNGEGNYVPGSNNAPNGDGGSLSGSAGSSLSDSGLSDGGIGDTVRLIGRELARPGIATTAVLAALVDVALIQALRPWLPDVAEDPVVARALRHLHADPARPWTTASLASAIAVSRSTLTRRFPAALGETPAAYLARWRLDLAARRLRTTDQPVEAIAAAVGYRSVPAFSRAFTRSYGATPGRYREARRHREDSPAVRPRV